MKHLFTILLGLVLVNIVSGQINCDAYFNISYDSTTNELVTIPANTNNAFQHTWTICPDTNTPSNQYYSWNENYYNGLQMFWPSGTYFLKICHGIVDTLTGCNSSYCDTITIRSNRPCNPYFFYVLEPTTAVYFYYGSTNAGMQHLYISNGDTLESMDYFSYSTLDILPETVTHIIYDSLGCNSSYQFDMNTSIKSQIYSFKIFPNPANDLVYIESPIFTGKAVVLSIINSVGQAVLTKRIKSINNVEEVDVSMLPNGIYTMLISDGKSQGIARIAKSR